MEYTNKLILVEKREKRVALVTLNNPPINMVTLPLSAELVDTMHKLDKDEDVRVIVLTGSGSKAFCVGSDIKEFPTVWDDPINKKMKRENEAFNSIEFISKPVIAAMEGTICGGGAEMSMACDLRILAENGKMAFPEVNLGVFPASGGAFRLPKLVGPAKALELMYTGEFIDAAECLRIGLVNRVAPAGGAVAAALALAETMAAKPFISLKVIKRSVRDLAYKSSADAFYPNLDFSVELFQSPDCAEGVAAFLEKRKPSFK